MSKDKTKNNKTKNEKVGYKKPPKKSQFKKGKSGNPKGRPKKSDHLYFGDLCIDMMNEEITITENGVKRTITKKEAFLRAMLNHSLSGKSAQSKILVDILSNFVIPHEERKIERQNAQDEIDNYKPTNAIEAAAHYKSMVKSLKHED